MRNLYILAILSLFLFRAEAQEDRYLKEVFADVEIMDSIVYGVNATILYVPVLGEAVPQPLLMDVYMPEDDPVEERPLILFFHSGNFLPYPQNTSISGTRKDSSTVTFCKRLAKMGYVVASVDYRLGWDLLNPEKDVRVFTLINAAYRGVQDARTCIRYFRKTYSEAGNPYGIDTSRITIFGQGTGGYVGMNTAILDDYNKIPTASDGKFTIVVGPFILPMIMEEVNGDIYGTSWGTVPAELAAVVGLPVGDTLCIPNHVGYSSDFHLSVNAGGAMGDSAWIDPGQVPMISFHVPSDPFAPYKEGLVLVPVNPPLEVVKVQGSYVLQALANQYGNNQVFVDANIDDNWTTVANTRNDGYEGLCPLIGTGGPNDSAPWDFWDTVTNVNHDFNIITNPDMSKEKALTYMDTILGYFAPRAFVALDLMTTSVTNRESEVDLLIYPNPSSRQILIAADEDHEIRDLYLVDLQGKVLQYHEGVDNRYYMIRRGNLPPGQYYIHMRFDDGLISKAVSFH